MRAHLRFPSPAMLVAMLALFISLGGSGYAATQIGHSAAKPKKSKAPSQQALIKTAVTKYFTSHHSQFVGAAGAAGAAGATGVAGVNGTAGTPGSPGLPGEPGPMGLASQSAELAGPVETGSSSHVNLGGPSLTVNVGSSGLVAYWAKAKIAIKSGAGKAEVWLLMPSGEAAQLVTTFGDTFYTKPESDEGTFIFNPGLSTVYLGPGKKTLSLQYDDSSGTAEFSEVELVVIPL